MKQRKGQLPLLYVLTVLMLLAAIFGGSRAVTVMSEGLPIERKVCIIIDPGHGGEDGGAVSCTGLPESAYNLEIALRLQDLFHLLGYETKILRTTDTSIYTKGETLSQKKLSDLKERVRIVNETPNGLLLSIHQNNFPDSRYSGSQVFYPKTPGSKDFANCLQEILNDTLHPKNGRQCKAADKVYLMERIQCTGVLIECGFLSNPEEEAKLRSPEYQKKLCCAIASATGAYVSREQ